MIPIIKRILNILPGMLFCTFGFAQIPPMVKQEIQNRVTLDINPSIALAIHDSLGDHYFVSGYSDEQRSTKAGVTTLYRIGNLGNTLTGLLTAALETSGSISKDSALGDLVTPALPIKDLQGRTISILDVVTHRSGITDKRGIALTPGADWDTLFEDGAIQAIRPYQSGKRFLYSDWAITLLANGLAEYTHTPYHKLITRKVLDPLELHLTFLPPDQKQVLPASGISSEEITANTNPLSAPSLWWTANIEDLLAYGKKMLYPPAAMEKTVKMALTPYHNDQNGVAAAMGWLTNDQGLRYHIGHFNGYNTFLAVDLIHKRVVTLATNTDKADITDLGLHLLDPQSQPLERYVPQTISADHLKAFSGTYINDAMNLQLELQVHQDTLKVIQQEDTLSLHYMGDNRFFYSGLKAQLEFEMNEAGQVVGVLLNKNGQQMMFIKAE